MRRARERDQGLFLEEVKRRRDYETMGRRPEVAVREFGDGSREREHLR